MDLRPVAISSSQLRFVASLLARSRMVVLRNTRVRSSNPSQSWVGVERTNWQVIRGFLSRYRPNLAVHTRDELDRDEAR